MLGKHDAGQDHPKERQHKGHNAHRLRNLFDAGHLEARGGEVRGERKEGGYGCGEMAVVRRQ